MFCLSRILAIGAIWRGWAHSASGNTAEGIPWIEQGIRESRATGSVLSLPQAAGVVLGEPGFTWQKEEGETALGLDGEKVFSPEMIRKRSDS
jgi:hypothetical protein